MSTLGILGAVAQGYTEAAKERRNLEMAKMEHERDLQISLVDKLLSDPSVPEEYKGQLLQHRIDVTNTPVGKKLPSLDKLTSSLPMVQQPKAASPSQQTIQLPGAPPTMAAGSAGSPSDASAPSGAALPPSALQKPAGSAPVPPNINPGLAPASLPPTPIQMPTRPPIADAGQFHLLTQQEQQDRQMAALQHQVDRMVANGVPLEQAQVAVGMRPKPELHNVPFLGTAIDPYTHQVITGGTGQSRPRGALTNYQLPDGRLMSLQQVQTGDGKYHYEDLAGNVVVPDPTWQKLVPQTLPTERTSTTADEFGMKSTTRSLSRKVVPGTGGVGKPAAAPSGALPKVPTLAASGSAKNSGLTPQQARDARNADLNATKLVQRDAVKASADTRNMVNLLDTQQDYMDGIAKGTSAPSPRKDLALIVAAVRAMNPGTVRLPNKELEMEIRAGSWGQRFSRQMQVASEGTLPDDQRNDLFSVVRDETTKTATNAAKNWQQAMGKQPLPSHLARFGVVKPDAPPSGKPTTPEEEAAQYLKGRK